MNKFKRVDETPAETDTAKGNAKSRENGVMR